MNLPGNFERFFGNLPWRPFNCKSASREAVRYAKHLKCLTLPDYVPDFTVRHIFLVFIRVAFFYPVKKVVDSLLSSPVLEISAKLSGVSA